MEAMRSSQEAPRSIGASRTLVRAPNTTGYTPGARRTSTSSKRARYVEIPGQKAIWATESSREASRMIGSARLLETALNTMEYAPGVWRTSTSSKRTHYVEIPGQKAIWASKSDRQTSRTTGSAEMMGLVSDRMGMGAGWCWNLVFRIW
jgi:hypothetical protein